MAVGTGKPFEGEFLLVMDQLFLMTTVELMLGGSAKEINLDEAQGFTAIEMGFGERIAAAIMAEIQRALTVVGKAELELDHVETDPDSIDIAKLTSLCARMQFDVAMAGHAGEIELVIPYDALEPIRPGLSKIYFGDRGQSNEQWQKLIEDQIERAHMDLEVVLAEELIPIQRIMAWKPGDVIDFGIEEGADATLVGSDEAMFKVSLGKRNNGFVAVQITEKFTTEEDPENVGNRN
jgi:flagellar motor switch protein FliM